MWRPGPLLAGLALAALFCVAVASLPAPRDLDVLAIFLGATASVYAGAALAAGRPGAIALETAAFLVLFALALAGRWWSPALLAGGYALHGAWDVLHHPPRLGAPAGATFPPLCALFDWVVAAWVLFGRA